MTTLNGGSAVKSGYYLSKSNWEIFPVARDGERLPGPAAEHYVSVPTAAVFLLMPVLGGLMVVFLPFIGLFLSAQAAVRPIAGMFRRSALTGQGWVADFMWWVRQQYGDQPTDMRAAQQRYDASHGPGRWAFPLAT